MKKKRNLKRYLDLLALSKTHNKAFRVIKKIKDILILKSEGGIVCYEYAIGGYNAAIVGDILKFRMPGLFPEVCIFNKEQKEKKVIPLR